MVNLASVVDTYRLVGWIKVVRFRIEQNFAPYCIRFHKFYICEIVYSTSASRTWPCLGNFLEAG